MSLLTYEQALASIPAKSKRHILLGNGFSQAWKPDVFSYASLLDKASLETIDPKIKNCFDALGTTDFEVVIRTLKDAGILINVYGDETGLSESMIAHSNALKSLLVSTISANHPDGPLELTTEQFRSSRKFIRTFKNIYTLNYDLLLYWSLLHSFDDETVAEKIDFDDGFRNPSDVEASPYVTWEIENTNDQNIFYLHGALHLFEADAELLKFSWNRTGLSLLTQIRSALDSNRYPLIVAEGTANQKMSRIMQSSYLQRGLKSLASISGTLVIYGFSFSDNDTHILKRIAKGKMNKLIVGIYGDPESKPNRLIKKRATDLKDLRPHGNRLEVSFFDAATANVWTSTVRA